VSWGGSWRTFRGQTLPIPTNAEMVESSIQNAEQAARDEQRLLDLIERCTPGDMRLRDMHLELTAARSDQRHWREYAEHYRRETEGERRHWSDREPGEDG
jgi:hypothetical protein